MVTKGLSQFQRSPWFWALLLRPWCKALHLWPGAGLSKIWGGVGTIFHLLQLPPDRTAFLASSGRALQSPEWACGRIQGLGSVKPAEPRRQETVVCTWLPPLLLASLLFTRKKSQPSMCISCCFLVYNTAVLRGLPFGFLAFSEERGGRKGEREEKVLFGISQQCLSPLRRLQFKIQISSDKTNPGWLFSLMVSILGLPITNDCNTTGFCQTRVEILNIYLQFPALGNNS